MELTEAVFEQRIEELRKIYNSEDDDKFKKLSSTLKEKGVECSIIVPIIEIFLNFNTFSGDVEYEASSKARNDQRLDFLIDEKFIIEVKKLGSNLDDHYKQIREYIKLNDDISYGILTNGVDYQIWIQKSFIERKTDKKVPQIKEEVIKVFELSLVDDSVQFFKDSLSIFKKKNYEKSFKKLASLVEIYTTTENRKGGTAKLHGDIGVNKELKDRIKKEVSPKIGIYYKDLETGKLKSGDKLVYQDDCVIIPVEITSKGNVKLRKGTANVTNFIKAQQNGWIDFITLISDQWLKSDAEFNDPIEIIKVATGKQRLKRNKYKFNKIK